MMQVFSLLISVVLVKIRENPQQFFSNLKKRTRLAIPFSLRSRLRIVSEFLWSRLSTKMHPLSYQCKLTRFRGPSIKTIGRDRIEELKMEPVYRRFTTNDFGVSHDLKVLYLITNSIPFTNSGYTKRSHSLLKSLIRRGVQIEAVTRLGYPMVVGKISYKDSQEIEEVLYRRILPCIYPGTVANRHRKAARYLEALVRAGEFRILHTTTDFSNAIVANLVSSAVQIPWIYEVRGELENTWLSNLPKSEQDLAEKSEYYRKVRGREIEFAKDADAVIALSEISKAQLIQRGIDERVIHVIPNSIDEDLLDCVIDKASVRQKLGLPTEKTIIGTVTSVVGYEGLDTLVQSISLLPDNYVGLVVGDGIAVQELTKLAAVLNVSERMLFVGRKSEQESVDWYSALDIFVVPRRDTPVCRHVTPIKTLAAQALGIPVIASDLPALREVTGNVETYVTPESPGELTAAIKGCRPHSQGKEWVAARTWSAAAEKLEAVYRSVLT